MRRRVFRRSHPVEHFIHEPFPGPLNMFAAHRPSLIFRLSRLGACTTFEAYSEMVASAFSVSVEALQVHEIRRLPQSFGVHEITSDFPAYGGHSYFQSETHCSPSDSLSRRRDYALCLGCLGTLCRDCDVPAFIISDGVENDRKAFEKIRRDKWQLLACVDR